MTASIRASLFLEAQLGMAALTAAFAAPKRTTGEATSHHTRHWSYGGENGPQSWAEIDPSKRNPAQQARSNPRLISQGPCQRQGPRSHPTLDFRHGARRHQ